MVKSLCIDRRGVVAIALFLALVAALWATAVGTARAADAIASYDARIDVERDGRLKVTAELTPTGTFPETLTQRFATRERIIDNSERVFQISDVEASSGGKAIDVDVKPDGDYLVVTIPTAGGSAPITLSYTVVGAAVGQADDTTMVSWRVLQGLSAQVDSVDVVVAAAAMVLEVSCVSGPPAAPGVCGWFSGGTEETTFPTFHDGPRGAGEIVQPSVRYPGSSVAADETVVELWSLDRAFRAGPAEILTALGVLVLGGIGLWALHRKFGRDATSMEDPTRVGHFAPVGDGVSQFRVDNDIRPGLVGTLLDENVDPIDVTATVLDLAVRGHLRITELPRGSEYAPREWTFTRLENPADELLAYEKDMLDAVAPAEGGGAMSSIAGAVTDAVPQIQSDLYDEVVARGWFVKRPDDTRNLWGRLGWVLFAVAVVVGAVLVAFTTFGLLAVVLVALALGLVFVSTEMPARTSAGTSVLGGLKALQSDLLTHPTDQVAPGREYQELSRVLPYAVVLGGQERWLAALVSADDDEGVADPTDLDWYHAPETWHLQDLPDSLRSFLLSLQGTLYSR